ILPRHHSAARADVSLCRRRHDDRLFPALRRAVCDDCGWGAARDDESRALHVRGGLPVVADGRRRRNRVCAVRDHSPLDAAPAPPAAGARLTMVATRATEGPLGAPRSQNSARLVEALLYGLLIGGAVIALLPTLWMISASFMATG